jgi:hypothetical protein
VRRRWSGRSPPPDLLRLNVHLHSLALDGVYVRDDDDGPLVFHALPEPNADEVAQVARRTAERIVKLLVKLGRSLDPEMDELPDALELEHPALAGCYGAAARGIDLLGARAGQPTLRVVEPLAGRLQEPVAQVGGFNVHAKLAVDGRDRQRLERICRYMGRPPRATQICRAQPRQRRMSVSSRGPVAIGLGGRYALSLHWGGSPSPAAVRGRVRAHASSGGATMEVGWAPVRQCCAVFVAQPRPSRGVPRCALAAVLGALAGPARSPTSDEPDGDSCPAEYLWTGPTGAGETGSIGTLTFVFADRVSANDLALGCSPVGDRCGLSQSKRHGNIGMDLAELPVWLTVGCHPSAFALQVDLAVPDLRTLGIGTVDAQSFDLSWAGYYAFFRLVGRYQTGTDPREWGTAFDSTATASLTITTATGDALPSAPWVSPDFERSGQLHLNVVIAPGTPAGSPAELPGFDLVVNLHQTAVSYQAVGSSLVPCDG